MAEIAKSIQERTTFRVFCVPEAATLLVKGGLRWENMTNERIIAYQMQLLQVQIHLEDAFTNIARNCGAPALVLCDRGTMDGRAYSSKEQFDEIMQRGGWTIEQLRDQRYDAVIHMVTAAIGAEDHYTLENNQARFETIEQAREADRHLRQMYVGHPRIKLIDNLRGEGFDEKVNRTVDFAFEVIGQAIPKHHTRRFFVPAPPNDIPLKHEELDVRIVILLGSTPSNVRMVLSRRQGASVVNILQTTTEEADGTKTVRRDTLNEREASMILRDERDPAHQEVTKKNYSFTVGELFFDLAIYEKPDQWRGRAILYVEGMDASMSQKDLPSWLGVDQETTDDRSFSNYDISLVEKR